MALRSDKECDFLVKIVLCGDSGVGKSTMLSTLSFYLEPAPGVDIATRIFQVEAKLVKSQIWVLSGLQSCPSMMRAYYRDALGAFVLYDVTNKKSFDNAQVHLRYLRQYADPETVILIVGNKSDLSELREVTKHDGEALAQKEGLLFVEISSLDARCIDKAFKMVFAEMYSRFVAPGVIACFGVEKFFLCRRCRTRIADIDQLVIAFEGPELVCAIFETMSNVLVDDLGDPFLNPADPSYEFATVTCCGCDSFSALRYLSAEESDFYAKPGRFLVDLNRLLLWDGSCLLFADTLDPLDDKIISSAKPVDNKEKVEEPKEDPDRSSTKESVDTGGAQAGSPDEESKPVDEKLDKPKEDPDRCS